jgi:hypothetical protein
MIGPPPASGYAGERCAVADARALPPRGAPGAAEAWLNDIALKNRPTSWRLPIPRTLGRKRQ